MSGGVRFQIHSRQHFVGQKYGVQYELSVFSTVFQRLHFLIAYFSPSFKQYLKTNTQISIYGFFKVLDVWIMLILKANNMFQLCLVWC